MEEYQDVGRIRGGRSCTYRITSRSLALTFLSSDTPVDRTLNEHAEIEVNC